MFQIATCFLEFPFAILPVNGRMIAERALSCNLLKEVACEKEMLCETEAVLRAKCFRSELLAD